MQQAEIQPNASPIPDAIVSTILRAAAGGEPGPRTFTVSNHGEYSNDLAQVGLGDGRTLMIKRGRHPWSGARLAASRTAADLLDHHSDVVAPRPLPLPRELHGRPLDVYWRIGLPTLEERWPRLSGLERKNALRSIGTIMRRMHSIRLRGYGDLSVAMDREISLSQVLAEDLGGRLMPAVNADWPEGVRFVERLLEMIPDIVRRAPSHGVLVHGDLHLGNLLASAESESARCVGVLDLENAHSAPRESDLARLGVMHTTLFNRPLEGRWFERVMSGYGAETDPLLMRFYALYHLVNLGYVSALLGHDWHAGQVAAAAAHELEALVRTPGDGDAGARLERRVTPTDAWAVGQTM